jgi:hypothetical protein
MRGRLAIAVAFVGATIASPTLAQGGHQAEIDFLIARVEQSGCQFVRNGAAHPAPEAAKHLRMKLGAARRSLSAEQFIEHVASKSSISGAPYLIRCSGRTDEPSAAWLRRALKERSG